MAKLLRAGVALPTGCQQQHRQCYGSRGAGWLCPLGASSTGSAMGAGGRGGSAHWVPAAPAVLEEQMGTCGVAARGPGWLCPRGSSSTGSARDAEKKMTTSEKEVDIMKNTSSGRSGMRHS